MENKHTDIRVAGKHDLLSSLVDANNKEDDAGLTDSELMGIYNLTPFIRIKSR